MSYRPYEEYVALLNQDDLKAALEYAVRQRNFEIEFYFKRAAYFWTFVAVAFAGYFAITKLGNDGNGKDPAPAFLVSCLGALFTFGWYWVNRGNSYWHIAWEIQVKALGKRVPGPLFEPKLNGCRRVKTGPYRVSITGINELLSIYVFVIWGLLAVRSITEWQDWTEPVAGFNLAVIGGITLFFGYLIWRICVGEKDRDELTLVVHGDETGDRLAEQQAMVAKLKHLELVHNVIAKMNRNSFLIKGWMVTVVSALFALAVKNANVNYAVVSYIAILVFWVLDAFYLSQEGQYRALYDTVRAQNEEDIDFSLDASSYNTGRNTWRSAVFSRTLVVLYLLVFAITLIILFLTGA